MKYMDSALSPGSPQNDGKNNYTFLHLPPSVTAKSHTNLRLWALRRMQSGGDCLLKKEGQNT
jgi:hypothetical protein